MLIIDDHIPFIKGALDDATEILYLPAQAITRRTLIDTRADALIIRTRTRCDAALLSGTRIRFIATATIGTDHIDTDYCRQAGISWANAPGCNARSVAQYIGSALALYAHETGEPLTGKTIGIIGHGHVGSQVATLAHHLGMNTLLCDPPKAATDPDPYVDLPTIAAHSDIITVHTPLTTTGPHPTHHLIDHHLIHLMPRRPLIINAARGGIIDEDALLDALDHRIVSDAVIDCWQGEPHINPSLLRRALISTPHIAGYSADGKLNATRQVLTATANHLGIPLTDNSHTPTTNPHITLPSPLTPCLTIPATDPDLLLHTLLSNYKIYRDSTALKTTLTDPATIPATFEHIRNHYPTRRELDITTHS